MKRALLLLILLVLLPQVAAAEAPVHRQPLQDIPADSAGLPGLAYDPALWQGISPDNAFAALHQLAMLPPLPAIAPVLEELLVTPAPPPAGTITPGAWLRERVAVLNHYAAYPAALMLGEQAEPALRPWQDILPVAFAKRPLATVCSDVNLTREQAQSPALDMAQLVCWTVAGNTREADLLLNLLREQGDSFLLQAVAARLGYGKQPALPEDLSLLDQALYQTLNGMPVKLPTLPDSQTTQLWPQFVLGQAPMLQGKWLVLPYREWLKTAGTMDGMVLNSAANARQVRGLPRQTLQPIRVPGLHVGHLLQAIANRQRGSALLAASLILASWPNVPLVQQTGYNPALTAAVTAFDAFGYQAMATDAVLQLIGPMPQPTDVPQID